MGCEPVGVGGGVQARPMKKPKAKDRSKPDPDCRNCKGKGAYPPSEMAGMLITVRMGKCHNAIPCKRCHETN